MIEPSRLRRASIFRGFSPEELQQVGDLGHIQTFAAGDTIFLEGDPGRYLYVVMDGSVSIHCGDKGIAKCRAFEAFGEMGAFRQARRSATARAVTDVELVLFDETAVSRLLQGSLAVPLLLNVIAVLSDRLEAGNVWIASSLEAQRSTS